MDFTVNYLDLNDNEFSSFHDNLKLKLVKNANQFYEKYEQLETNYEKFKIEYEQRFVDLEMEHNQLKDNYEREIVECQTFKLKFNEIDDKYRTTSKTIKILDDEKETLQSNLQRLTAINQNLEAEKRDLLRFLDKRNQEIEKSNEDWKTLNRKLTESETRICELSLKTDELQNKESAIVFKEKQFQIDKERLLNEIEWLNKQLSLKSTQMLDAKASLSQQIYELESKLEQISNENRKNKNLLENSQSANTSMEDQISDLTAKLHESRENTIKLKADFDAETHSREKLIGLYKDEIEDCKSRLTDASQTLIELKNMLNEANQEYARLADEKHEFETLTNAQSKEKDDSIVKLEQELKNANELLSIAKRKGATVLSESDIEELSPAAAVASRLLKSGMTLTQIYSEYVNLSEQLQTEKSENARLKEYISEIINEIEDKAPILKRQKHEYEEALTTINNLTSQLEKSMMDYEVLKSKSEDSIKKYNLVYSENMRLKQDVGDLSRQVTTLLYEVEKLRAKLLNANSVCTNEKSIKKKEADETIDSSFTMLYEPNEAEVSSSSDIITKHMIDFRNIEELQQQNQKLIHFARGITEQKELEEKAEYEQRTKDYTEKLELAFRQLEEFRAQREKQEKVLEEICKQRDTYKNLLEQVQEQQKTKENASIKTNFYFGNRNENPDVTAQAAIEKLQQQLAKYQHEMGENARILNEDLDKYRQLNSELNTKYALCESKLESVTEKCKTLNTTVEKYKKECDVLKERNSKLNESIVKHEQVIIQNNSDINSNKEKLGTMEMTLRNSNMERDMFKGNYERLLKDHEVLVKENQSRLLILSNLETIKNGFDRSEREAKYMYTEKIEQLEKQNKIYMKKCETNEEQFRVIQKSFESQLNELEKRLASETEQHADTKTKFARSESELTSMLVKLQEYEAKLHSNEQLLQMTRNSKSSATISRLTELEDTCKELKSKLNLSEKDIVSLKIQLEDSKFHLKQYCTISESTEKALHEANDTNDKLKKHYDDILNQIEVEKANLENELRTLIATNDDLSAQFNTYKTDSNATINELNARLTSLNIEFSTTMETLNKFELLLNERTIDRDAYVAQLRIVEEASKNLEADKASLTSTVNDLTERLTCMNAENEQLKQTNDLIRKQHDDTIVQLNQVDVKYNEKCMQLENENEEKLKQINLLQDELSKLSESIQILQKDGFNTTLADLFRSDERRDGAAGEGNDDNDNDERRRRESTTHLFEINRFLRAQKEQLEEKFSSLQIQTEINAQRLRACESELDLNRQRIQQYESEVEHLKRFKAQHDGEKYSNVTSEDFNLISDTNKRLKEQLDSLVSENDELNERIRQIDEHLSQVKAEKCALELEREAVLGERTCMQIEIKRWKERLDNLILTSNYGDEWQRAQAELTEAQKTSEQLTTIVNTHRKEFADQMSINDYLKKELEEAKQKMQYDRDAFESKQKELNVTHESAKLKLNTEFEIYKQERMKKDEMFKALINELKLVITSVQNEVEFKNIELTSGERGRNIKDDLQKIKNGINERIGQFKSEIGGKTRELTNCKIELEKRIIQINENEIRNKTLENELASKTSELEQRNKLLQEQLERAKVAITTAKNKIEKQKQRIDELTRSDALVTGVAQESQEADQLLQQQPPSQNLKQELDDLKLKFSNAQNELNVLKNQKVSQEPTTNVIATGPTKQALMTTQQGSASAVTMPTLSTAASSVVPTTGLANAAANTSTAADVMPKPQQQHQQQQQQRTAYITPSRISKIAPLNAPRFGDPSSRRTAAVQPTPQQLVTPLAADPASATTTSTWSQQAQQAVATHVTSAFIASSEAVEVPTDDLSMRTNFGVPEQMSDQPSTSQHQGAVANNQQANKRTRERENDMTDESTVTDLNVNKKPRQLESTTEQASSSGYNAQQQQQQQESIASVVATIEPYSSEQQYADTSEFLIINNEVQELDADGVVHEEIVIEESESDDINEENDEGDEENDDVDEQSSSNDVIITDQNSQQYYQMNEAGEIGDSVADDQQNYNQTEASSDLNLLDDADENDDDNDDDQQEQQQQQQQLHQQSESDNQTNEEDDGTSGNDEADVDDNVNYDENADENETLQTQEDESPGQNRENNQSITPSGSNLFASVMSSTVQQFGNNNNNSNNRQATSMSVFNQQGTSPSRSQTSERKKPIKPIVWDVDSSGSLVTQQISGPTSQQFAQTSSTQGAFRLRRMPPTQQQQQQQEQLQRQQHQRQVQQFEQQQQQQQQLQSQPPPQQQLQQQQLVMQSRLINQIASSQNPFMQTTAPSGQDFGNLINTQTQQRVIQQRMMQNRTQAPQMQLMQQQPQVSQPMQTFMNRAQMSMANPRGPSGPPRGGANRSAGRGSGGATGGSAGPAAGSSFGKNPYKL